MGHLFYTELGNKGLVGTDGTFAQPDFGLTNTGDFVNLTANGMGYWSGTEYSTDPEDAWRFNFNFGNQSIYDKAVAYFNALAVRSGEVSLYPALFLSYSSLRHGTTHMEDLEVLPKSGSPLVFIIPCLLRVF